MRPFKSDFWKFWAGQSISMLGSSFLGALIGGFAIERTKNVGLVYAAIGILVFFIALAFSFSPLGRAERLSK